MDDGPASTYTLHYISKYSREQYEESQSASKQGEGGLDEEMAEHLEFLTSKRKSMDPGYHFWSFHLSWLISCRSLVKLRTVLKSKPVSWIKKFVDAGGFLHLASLFYNFIHAKYSC